jgi:hypothetical protein
MQFFDIVALKEEIDLEGLARRLGYRKMFLVGKDVEIARDATRLDGEGSFIVRSGDNEALSKAVRSSGVIGVIVEGGKVSGRFVDELRTHEKLLFIPAAPLVCPDQGGALRNLHAAKGAVRAALMGKAGVAMVTLAEERECLLSSRQMLEIARLLCPSDRAAEAMLTPVGGLL